MSPFSLESRNYPASKELASAWGLSRTDISCVPRFVNLPSSEFWQCVSFSIFFPARYVVFVPGISYVSFRSHMRLPQRHATIASLSHVPFTLSREVATAGYKFTVSFFSVSPYLRPQHMLILVLLSCQRRFYISHHPPCVKTEHQRQIISMQLHVFVHCTDRPRASCRLSGTGIPSQLDIVLCFSLASENAGTSYAIQHWLCSLVCSCQTSTSISHHDTACSRGVFPSAPSLSISPCCIYFTQNNLSALQYSSDQCST